MEDTDSGIASTPDLQQMLDDARLAFGWAFCADGDPAVGIELTSNLACALLDAGLFEDCRAHAAQAVDALEKLPAGTVDAACERRVRAALMAASSGMREPLASQPAKTARQRAGKRESHTPAAAAMAPPACFITT